MADLTDSFSSDSRWHDLAGLIETENLSRAFYESTNNSVNGTTVATSFTPPELDVCGDLSADPGARSKNTHSVRYQCSQLNCRSTFARPSDRDRHVRSFHTLRVFSCPESHCERNTEHGGRGFSRHDKLIEHLRSVHSDRVHIAKSKATETLKGLMSSTESATDERDFEPELQEALRDTGKKRKLDFKKVESEIQDTSILTKAHDEYTIGWICLTTTAFVASQAFLDEEHGSPAYMFANDINCYKLGRIGGHYVVIANSPLNEYGTPGAIAIDNLMRAFPKIRATLMVDIGGGAPSRKHDIRLGDIIVGIAQDMDGGVVQYDFGKTTQDETFRQTRYTAQPPRILRTAMNGLRAQYERKGHRLEEAINKILKQNPKLQKRYKRPDRSYDRLFRSDYIHPTSSGSTCAEVCSADPSNLILRQERDIDDDSPTIHYGLIASANQVMRDALIRDKLVVEKDVLCFEMAAAGLSNRVSCLVIRGVCDYADSHKDTMWQGYAAMAATAYTKDLLHEIPPTRMKAEKALRGTLFDDPEMFMEMPEGFDKFLHAKYEKEREAILNLITPFNYATKQSEYLKSRHLETCQWFVDSIEYRGWLNADGDKRTLFCPGMPGSGKTVLASIVVDDLCHRFRNDTTIGVAYIFCNFQRRSEQNPVELLASLLKQLSQKQSLLPECVRELYETHKENWTRPSLDEISSAIQSVTAGYTRVYIIVDALDECQTSNGCRMRFLREIFNLQAKYGAHFFATSRFIPDIAESFKGSTSLEVKAHEEDIRSYIDGSILNLPGFVRCNPTLQDIIKKGIVQAANGIFLFAKLYATSLEDKITVKSLMRALNHFQEQIQSTDKDDTIPMLAGAHLHIKKRIKGQKAGFRQLAEMVLLWITCARKPITAFELQHALAMEVNAPNFDVDLVPDLRDIILSCAGLVQVDEKSGIIRFVHDTIRIYFEQTREDWFPDGEMMMTRVCLTYLSLSVFDSGFCETDEELEGRLESYPLYGYAAQNWGHHARNTLPLCSEALNFLNCEPKVEASNQALVLKHDLKKPGYSQQVPRQVTGLHLAAYFGLQEAVIILLARYCSNLRDSHGRTPLLIAVENDQTTVIKLLLKKDADPELKDHHGRTPLSLAIEKGYEFSKGFLESEGNAGPQVIENWTPLPHTATTMRMFKGKPLSTSGGSNLDVRTSLDHTHPSYMVNGEDFNIIRLIHKTGANPDINATDGRAPLSYAAEHGRLDIVGLLLEKGADPNKKAIDGRTPLSYAAGHGRLDIVGLLLDKGADPNEKAIDGRTPLLYAAENGHFTIAKLLLEMGADPNTNALNNRSPLL